MKILFDYQIFEEQKVGGISRYFFELFKNFITDPEIEIQLPVNFSENIYINSIKEFTHLSSGRIHPYQKFMPWIQFKGKWKLYSLFSNAVYAETNQDHSITKIRKNDYDIFHPSYYYTYYLDDIKNKPLVITIHDMITEIFPGYFPLDSVVSSNKKQLAKRADAIIVVSENTKSDLIYYFDLPPEKINVVYHGNSLDSSLILKSEKYNLPETYLLYVGSRQLYKNFLFLIESVVPILKKSPEIKIVCTGQPFSQGELEFFSINNIEKSLIHFFANDNLLAQLYSSAKAFVFPSLYEGFGMPVLEAFSCGCPCLLSNSSSLPEVGGNAAIYFDPKSAESIRQAVNIIVFDTDVQDEFRQKGFVRAKEFSWNKTSIKTKEVYQSLL